MGYELNRLMQQYGVSTPSMTAPPMALAPDASEADKAAYAADKQAYDTYRAEYMNRLNTVPMYGQRQYSTVFAPVGTKPPTPAPITPPTPAPTPVGPTAPAPEDNPVDTLDELYDKYLYRDPDEAGAEYWNQQMAGGLPFSDVYNMVKESPEAQKAAYYQKYLGRAPDETGMDYWRQQLNAGTGLSDILSSIQNSPEAQFNQTYQKYMGRRPDEAGLEYWQQQLAAGLPFQDAYEAIKNSPEALQYQAAAQQTPSGTGQLPPADTFQQSPSPAAVAQSATQGYGNVPIENVVRNAYQQLGRQGFGAATSQIDIPGYQYWVNQAQQHNWSPEQTNQAIIDSANWYAVNDPNSAGSQYTRGYQNLQKTGSFYDQPLKSPVYTYTPPPAAPPGPTVDQYAELQKQIEDLRNQQSTYSQNNYGQPYYDSNLGYGAGDGTGGEGSGPGDGPDGPPGWARGGEVKKYAPGGDVEVEEEVAPVSPMTAVSGQVEPSPVEVTEAPPTAVAPAPAPEIDRSAALQAMLAQYGPQSGGYTSEVAAARERHRAETDAFNKLLESQLNSPESEQHSKAEMYFRLAAAFGSPTKTGQFGEHLGMAGRELAEHAKGKRESAAGKRDLMLQAQQLKMAGAKEDLATVRALEAESMKDRRAIAQEMIKEYIASGKPQSEAGRRAKDMGLVPGTPEYQKKVEEYAQLDLQNKMNLINAQLASLTTANENLKLRQEAAGRLSPGEIKLKVEAEDLIANSQQALKDLEEAYRLNPNTFAGGWLEKGQRALLEAGGSNDPKVVNTRIVENLLGSQGLAKLRATFGGNPTEGERAIMMELEGIGSKTREERAEIIKRIYKVLRERVAREQRRLDDITSGAYRTTTPLKEEE